MSRTTVNFDWNKVKSTTNDIIYCFGDYADENVNSWKTYPAAAPILSPKLDAAMDEVDRLAGNGRKLMADTVFLKGCRATITSAIGYAAFEFGKKVVSSSSSIVQEVTGTVAGAIAGLATWMVFSAAVNLETGRSEVRAAAHWIGQSIAAAAGWVNSWGFGNFLAQSISDAEADRIRTQSEGSTNVDAAVSTIISDAVGDRPIAIRSRNAEALENRVALVLDAIQDAIMSDLQHVIVEK